ncbi:hypothetical protein ACWEJ7_20225 [Streptomyces albidoflavus]
MTQRQFSRRGFLSVAAGAAGALALGLSPATAVAAPDSKTWKGDRSANGWPILQEANEHQIEGTGRTVRLAEGDAAVLLLYVARRFHYEIDQLKSKDVQGHSTSRHIEQQYESDYLSGSAITIRSGSYPAGVKDGLFPHEVVVVRDILTELDGTVAWGGDAEIPKQSHFGIALPPGHPRLKKVANRIRGWEDGPISQGAGATDAFDPGRRAKARAFTRPTP